MGITNPENDLDIANGEVRAARALRDDLLAVLFPQGEALPSERLQTQVKVKLQSLVSGFEAALEGAENTGQSWDMLARSGLLREPALIEFALARVAEEALQENLASAENALPLAQLPASLFDHENPRIADMAKSLLHAERGDNALFHRLDPELLHLLCWRIVAALQEAEGSENDERIARGQALLSTHDPDSDPASVARKLVFFLGSESHSTLLDPRRAGLQLFVATLAQMFSLSSDLIFRLIGAQSLAPLLVLLRGADLPMAQLPSIIIALRGERAQQQSVQIAESYSRIDPVEARAHISGWSDEAGGLE